MECEPADNIVVRVSDYRVADEGWIRLSLKNVAGDAGVSKVEFTTSKIEVSYHHLTHIHEPEVVDVLMSCSQHCPLGAQCWMLLHCLSQQASWLGPLPARLGQLVSDACCFCAAGL